MHILSILFTSLILAPFTEWAIHYELHLYKNEKHKNHHIKYYNNSTTVELYPVIILPILYYTEFYLICIGILQYWIVHSLIHFAPQFLPKIIVNHHIKHHNNPNICFAICNPYIDTLCGTNF